MCVCVFYLAVIVVRVMLLVMVVVDVVGRSSKSMMHIKGKYLGSTMYSRGKQHIEYSSPEQG